jgi:hypothetical protein
MHPCVKREHEELSVTDGFRYGTVMSVVSCPSAAMLVNIAHLLKTLTGKLATPVFEG